MQAFFISLLSMPRYMKKYIMIFYDIIVLEISIILSYSLRQASWFWPSAELEKLLYLAPFLAVPVFFYFGLYQSIVRYMGLKVISQIVYAVTVYMIIWSIIGYYFNVDVPRSVLIYHDDGNIYKVSEYFSGFFVLCIINWLICLLLIGRC
jgi:Predicted nucleoside-diphosphate sugar epimerases